MADLDFVDLRWIYILIRRWWWLIIGIAVLAAIIAYIVTAIIPPVYQSSALLLVNPSKSSTTSQYNDLMAGTQLALTYSQMFKDRPVLETVISELGLKRSADALAKQITAEPVRSSQLIKLTVQDTNPTQAALIANTLAQAFTKRVEELSAQRYAGVLKSTNDRTAELQTQMTDLQTQIDALRSKKVTKDVNLASKQTFLMTLQTDYRSFQTSDQNLQNLVAEITGKVYIVEPVQVQQNPLRTASTASVVVSIGVAQPTGSTSPFDSQLTLTYGQLMLNPELLQGVIKELGLTETTDQLSGKISSEIVTGTQLIRFKIDDPDGLRAQLIMQSLANAFLDRVKLLLVRPYSDRLVSSEKQIKDLESSINNTQIEIGGLTSEIAQMGADLDRMGTDLTTVRADYRSSVQKYDQIQATAAETSDGVIVTEPAQAPKAPIENRMLYIALAAFLGLVIGVGLTFLLNYINTQIRTNQDVLSSLGMPVLSTIGQLGRNENDLVMISAPASSLAEDFHLLGQKIRLLREKDSIRTLMITSPVPSEGKSMIISNLAVSLSRTGLRIVLVDADLRLPKLHTLFGISQEKGLTNSLNTGSINGTLQSPGIGELKILTSGEVPLNPAEMLSSSHLDILFHELKEKSDLVLIDCPPVLIASDASILASKVDGVLLVLRAGSTESGSARDAVDALLQVNANLVGVVLNSIPNRKKSYYYHA